MAIQIVMLEESSILGSNSGIVPAGASKIQVVSGIWFNSESESPHTYTKHALPFTIAPQQRSLIDVSGGSVEVTLPNGAVGVWVVIGDYNGSASASNNVIIKSSDNIRGSAGDFILSSPNSNVILSYVDAVVGWRVVSNQSAITDAEIKTQYESNADTNAFDDAATSKLAGISSGADVSPTPLSNSQVKTQYELNTDTNAFTDSEKAKLSSVASNADASPTPLTNVQVKTQYELNAETNAFTDGEKSKLSGIDAGAEVNVGEEFSSSEQTKLANISSGADVSPTPLTNVQVKTQYELNAETNAFTDAEQSKLSGIVAGAQPNVGTEFTSTEKTKLSGIDIGAQVNVGSEFTSTEKTKLTGIATGAQVNVGEEFTTVEQSKLSGIAPNADVSPTPLTNEQVKSQYEANTDTNAFTNSAESKLSGIDTGAQVNVGSEFTSTEKTKLSGIDTGAQVNPTPLSNAQVKTQYELNSNTNTFTDAEQSKLSGLESSRYKGLFVSIAALALAITSGSDGDYADVDAGAGNDRERFIWDNDDSVWVKAVSISAALTDSQIKTQYELNADTNGYTDAEKTKLSGIDTGAQVNPTPLSNAQVKTQYELNADTNGYTDAEKSKLAAIAANAQVNVAANLSISTTTTTATVASSSGTNAVIPAATTAKAGVISSADKTKLNGIATGAQVNVGSEFTSTEKTKLGNIQDNAEANVGSEFTSTEKTKLTGIATGAQVNVGSEFTSTEKTKLTNIASNANNYSLPFANNSANWQTAYGWGNHASAGYNPTVGTNSDINTSGAAVLDTLVMTNGVITSHTTRNLTAANVGALATGGTAAKVAIITSFTGTYPLTVNVNGLIYSDTGITFTGSDSSLTVAGNVTMLSWTCTSDMRKKTNIQELTVEYCKEILAAIRWVSFDFIADGSHSNGVIAQELLEICVDAVIEDDKGFYSVNYMYLHNMQMIVAQDQELRLAKLEELIYGNT